jgi:hypothetical protein
MASLVDEFGRRRFLTSALGCGLTLTRASALFAGTEFWNAKDPSTWTEEEIVILTTKSPWAREAIADIKHTDDPTGLSSGQGADSQKSRRAPSVKIIVRWESAQPIRDALRAPLAADFDGHYVVSVTNLPTAGARPSGRGGEATANDTLDRMQNGATLRVKGKDPGEAGIVRKTRIGSVLFGFSRDYLHLSPEDREITFSLDTDQFSLKTKFDTKEMMYHGKLAV